MKSVLVFCGSNKGINPVYEQAAKELGKLLARQGIRLVYGAGNVGLMGVVADAALEHGGEVLGVIPYFLKEKEVCHTELTELIVVDSMAERKLVMAEHSDGVITLPGGYGTLDELFEMLTLVQISQVSQPIGILNVDGYFDHLIAQLDWMNRERFLKDAHRDLLIVSEKMDDLLARMQQHTSIGEVGKWEERD